MKNTPQNVIAVTIGRCIDVSFVNGTRWRKTLSIARKLSKRDRSCCRGKSFGREEVRQSIVVHCAKLGLLLCKTGTRVFEFQISPREGRVVSVRVFSNRVSRPLDKKFLSKFIFAKRGKCILTFALQNINHHFSYIYIYIFFFFFLR